MQQAGLAMSGRGMFSELKSDLHSKGDSGSSNRNQASDLDHLVGWQVEVFRHMGGIALHHGEQRFLPARQPLAVLTTGHRLVSNVVSHIGKIDGATTHLELRQ